MTTFVKVDEDIEDKLQEHFEPLKIVAFSNCCRLGCTDNYGDYNFQMRENGILFIRLHLKGLNFIMNPNQFMKNMI